MKTALLKLASARPRMYRRNRVANMATRRRNRRTNSTKALMRPHQNWGFFMPAVSCYGGTYRAGLSVSFVAGSVPIPTPVRSATITRRKVCGGPLTHKGTDHMKHAHSSSNSHAAAWRARALAALRSDSSLATRLARYNAHMERARALQGANAGGEK